MILITSNGNVYLYSRTLSRFSHADIASFLHFSVTFVYFSSIFYSFCSTVLFQERVGSRAIAESFVALGGKEFCTEFVPSAATGYRAALIVIGFRIRKHVSTMYDHPRYYLRYSLGRQYRKSRPITKVTTTHTVRRLSSQFEPKHFWKRSEPQAVVHASDCGHYDFDLDLRA